MTETNQPASKQDRQSKPAKRERFRPLNEPQKAKQEALNTLRQYDRMVELINGTLRTPQRFRLRPSSIQELNRISIKNIEEEAGRLRDVPIEIEGSKHQPPPAEDVSKHLDDLCDYVNDHWDDRSAFHLAAYVMWRLNWIHPFVDGNGRTTRAVSYYVLCAKLGFHIPGVTTVAELIAENKDPYYRALEAADAALPKGVLDVSEMEGLLSDLLAKQMVLALERGEAPSLNQIKGSKTLVRDPMHDPDNGTRASVKILNSRAAFIGGAICGFVALLFFMGLILLSVFGHPVPHDSHFLVIIFLALSGALSAGFLGGNASARGMIHLPGMQNHPLGIAVTGGVAVLIILLLLGDRLFK